MDSLKIKTENPPLKKHLIIITFAFYIVALIWVIVFKCNRNETLHILQNRSETIAERLALTAIPFKHVLERIAAGSVVETLAFIFNVICFIPFGALLCFLVKKKTSIIMGAVFSFCVEIFQLFSCWGGFDIADIILNTLGTVFGVIIYNVLFSKLSNKTIHTIAIICIALAIPFDGYAIVNTILHFPV